MIPKQISNPWISGFYKFDPMIESEAGTRKWNEITMQSNREIAYKKWEFPIHHKIYFKKNNNKYYNLTKIINWEA